MMSAVCVVSKDDGCVVRYDALFSLVFGSVRKEHCTTSLREREAQLVDRCTFVPCLSSLGHRRGHRYDLKLISAAA